MACVVYAERLQRSARQRLVALTARVRDLSPVDFEDRLTRGEVVYEADVLLAMSRHFGPRASRLGLLVSGIFLLANVGDLREHRVLWGLGLCFSAAALGYAYTRTCFRRNETELMAVRRQIRGATRPSEKKLA